MTENFLQYIWKYGLYYPLSANPGKRIEVINPGLANRDSGPDFFNAMVRIEETVMAGNVEIHINSSDWYRHGHHLNKAYDSVILQLVLNADAEVKRINGEIIPTAEVRFERRLFDNYRQLLDNEYWIPCEPLIRYADMGMIKEWLHIQLFKRLEQKARIMGSVLFSNDNDWQESFYQQLARNFGFRLNGCTFEMLARSLPFKLLLRHRDSLFQLEALLFGQAGMLEFEARDDYSRSLIKEYRFLRLKYNLKPVENHLWKFLRLRPAGFPTVRIAQFASLIHQNPGLFAFAIDLQDLKMMNIFHTISASGYWDNHYVFDKPSVSRRKSLGKPAVLSIIINTIVPFLYFYGKHRQIDDLKVRAVDFLKEIPPENNSIIRKWKAMGICPDNAFTSQALLQQKNEYCSYKRCLDCGIGNYLITKNMK
jgi:hypothetical protein